ncbi:MAG: diguanylate cyclase [Actinobacteria bacterium]|nr:diguanylate cyclase [Actinomycetota bacterium]
MAARRAFRNATTGRRMLLIATATFLPVVLVSFLLGSALNRSAGLTADVTTEVDTLVTPVLALSDELSGAQILLDRYVATGADVDRAAVVSRTRRIDNAFAALDAALTGRAETADGMGITTGLANARASWEFVRDTMAAPGFTVPADAEGQAALLRTLGAEIASVRSDLAGVAELATRRVSAAAAEADRSARGMRLLLLVAVPLSAFLAVILVAWLVRDLRHGTRALREAAEQLEDGRHGVRVSGLTHGDLAPVARAFNAMAERMELQSRELHEIANRDELTGVMNRRGFQLDLETEFERAVRYGRPLAFLLLDVDHFKAVNDTHGHPAGDVVLRAVADEIQDAVRGVDRVGRWGGEEFAVLLPETVRADAEHVAERVAKVIRQRVVIVDGDPIRVTASLGLTVFDPELQVATSTAELVERADRALYTAKEEGRDRVVFAAS